jgi:hypothetical protein
MRTLLGKTLAAPVAAIAILGGTIPTALADTAETTPIEESVLQPGPPPEEDPGLVPAPTEEAELPPTSGKPEDGTNAEYCGPTKNVYKPTANHGKVHAGVGAPQANYNGTSRTARSWFKSEVGGEVGISVTGELKVSGSVMLAEIEGKYGIDLSAKMTAKIGNEIQIDTPPRKTTYGKYGVWRLKNTGTSYTIYSNCRTSAKSTVTSHTPWYVGWYLWEQ